MKTSVHLRLLPVLLSLTTLLFSFSSEAREKHLNDNLPTTGAYAGSGKSLATITGHVFNDINNNLTFQAGEGLNNIKIWLFDLNAGAPYYRVAPIISTTTDASGFYTFTGVSNGDYQVRVGMSSMPSTLTRAVKDNDSYPNGLTVLSGVNGSGSYSNIDFGFAATSLPPSFSSARNFQFSSTNAFVNRSTNAYDLSPETGGVQYTPTITWTSDRVNAPGGDYGTNTYPQAAYSSAINGQDFPGNSKGGIHPADNTFQLIFGGPSYNPVNNDRQTTTIQFSNPVIDTKFSIYDIDHADPQSFSGRIDHVKVTGYNGAAAVMPVLINPSVAPWNTVSGNTAYGWADYPLNGYTTAYNSLNEDHGTVNVYFTGLIDKIVIEYEEWAPVIMPGKGLINATPADAGAGEASWAVRAPTERGISIGSVDYTMASLITLPVELVSFTAQSSNCNTTLNWKTASEQDLNYFEIEYAANGANFKSIGKVVSKNNLAGSSYNFNAPPNSITAYYRLKIIDYDGKYQYSDTRSVKNNCSAGINWSFAPNPVQKGSAISLNLFTDDKAVKKASIICWDATGRKYMQQDLLLQPGQKNYKLNIEQMERGIYFVGIYDAGNNLAGPLQKMIIQ